MKPLPFRKERAIADTTPKCVPTLAAQDLLHRLDWGDPLPFPESIKKDFSERLYKNGFVTVGMNSHLTLTGRGQDLLVQIKLNTAV